MKLTFIKITVAAFAFVAASVAQASTIEQLILDDNAGNVATIDVDNLGFVTCGGACGSLTFSPAITPHTSLVVTGTLGQFTLNVTGTAGATAIYPTLQNLTQINAASQTAGTLTTLFTDTDYCLGGGGCFGNAFDLTLTNNPDTAIKNSSTTFAAYADSANTIPAGTLIGAPSTPTTLTGVSSSDQSYMNPGGPSGSLSSLTNTTFTGKGSVQTTFQISTAGSEVPEPSTFALFGLGAGLFALGVRRRKA
jgi:hypothetical protein